MAGRRGVGQGEEEVCFFLEVEVEVEKKQRTRLALPYFFSC